MYYRQTNILRFISIFTLITFLIMTSGCSKLVNMPPEKSAGEKIKYIQYFTIIHGIVLKTDERILFSKKSGLFNKEGKTISGVTEENTRISNSLDDINLIILKQNITLDSTKIIAIHKPYLQREFDNNLWEEIDGCSVKPDVVLEFDKNGGFFDSTNYVIVGYTYEGNYVEMSIEKILSVTAVQSSLTKSILYPVLIIGSIAGLIAAGGGIKTY